MHNARAAAAGQERGGRDADRGVPVPRAAAVSAAETNWIRDKQSAAHSIRSHRAIAAEKSAAESARRLSAAAGQGLLWLERGDARDGGAPPRAVPHATPVDVLGRSGDTAGSHNVVRGQVAEALAPAARRVADAGVDAGAVLRVVDALHAGGGGPCAREARGEEGESGEEPSGEPCEEPSGEPWVDDMAGTNFHDKDACSGTKLCTYWTTAKQKNELLVQFTLPIHVPQQDGTRNRGTTEKLSVTFPIESGIRAKFRATENYGTSYNMLTIGRRQ